jgi:DNA-binding IscR family transcriptional regulator
MLAKSPQEISLGMVMETLDGTSAPLNCIDEPTECIQYSICAQRDVWQSVDQVVQNVLNFTSIGELAQRQAHTVSGGMYQI